MPRPGSGAMFDGIAERYDLVNRLASLGLDRGWRTRTARALALEPGQRVLDVATGTADLALGIARTEVGAIVVGVDPSLGMLSRAARKVTKSGLAGRIQLVVGVAEDLPFGESEFDAASMAFGIRNVGDRSRALVEIRRVVRPGGRVAILELCEPESRLARLHVHSIVPRIGAVASNGSSYRYLAQSIAAFPPPAELTRMLAESGLEPVEVAPLSFGAATLFLARARR